MKLLVARHGECVANVDGVVAGARNDSPLTKHGEDEARVTAEKLRGFKGRIVSSPLRRAIKTAEIIRDKVAPGEPITVEPLFIERDVGDATGLPLNEYFALEKAEAAIPHAETDQEMYDRVKKGLDRLKEEDAPVLLVSHGGTCRMIACIANGLSSHEFANFPKPQNGEIVTFDI